MGVGAPFEFDACRPNPAMIEGVHSLGEKIAPLGDGLLTHAPDGRNVPSGMVMPPLNCLNGAT